MKSSSFTNKLCITFAGIAMLAMSVTATVAKAQTLQCVETNGVKFRQLPNIDGGWDVRDSRNIVVADDFPCNTTGPITDIHIWGSWSNNAVGTITNFWIGIYNDVPAVTNFSSGQIVPSHPGPNLLWSQSFGPSQFAQSVYGNGSESFFDPSITNIIGTDTTAWYYCFYPTNPFVQQGSANAPTNYWLVAYVQLADQTSLYGWKNSLASYNDAAVWGNWDSLLGKPFGNWAPIHNFNQQPINLAFKLTTPTNTPPSQGCIETNGTKYVQWPNLNNGFDVWDDGPWVLADDFKCTNSGPVTDIHLWGSWLNDQVFTNLTFWLAIYDDVPAGPVSNFSHPGNLLWQEQFGPGQYLQSFWSFGQESFLDPGPPNVMGPDSQVWYYCFYPTNIFVQQGTAALPKIYWLMVYAQPPAGAAFQYGWKTTTNVQNDISVHAPWPGLTPTNNPGWTPTLQSAAGGPLDLAFKITTATNAPPPTGCVETNGVKYAQGPNLFGGLDVWNSGPWMLADDFKCINPGPISDIHIWGSWINDLPITGALTFWLGIYADVPIGPGNTFSHPGSLLWQQTFAPGQYAETVWSPGQESFLDPGPPQILGPDSQVWYYCFYPTNPFVQQGTAAKPTNYWLAAYAQLPAVYTNRYGWKTTTNVLNDISVHAPWPGFLPTNTPGWIPTRDVTGLPLDLAFKLTTPTNHCIIPVTCAVDKAVECGSSWSFDPPLVGPDPCCPNPPLITFSAFTNVLGPCKQIITGTWIITDCLGTTATCTQNVTVVDTTPPVITCASNKTVECGTAWTFDKPTALDACCGTNVTIIILNTFTNTPGPCQQIITRTWQATDCCTNRNVCSQTVTVVDTTPPTIICPTNMVVFTCDTNVMVTWTIAATDNCSSVTVTSTPPSGTAFLPNTTNTVTATARDACGNTSSCTFTVTIRRPVLGLVTIKYPGTNIVVLTWTNGFLQVSTNVTGPYVDVPGATSPYTNTTFPLPPTNRFYRLRCNSP